MSSFTVSKSILIQAPLDKVYAAVADFRQWPKWSPWLICDPGCRINFAEDGRKYAWNGPVCGSGVMTVLSRVPQRTLRCKLTLIKPENSISEVAIDVAARDKDTEVAWTLEGSVPLFQFFTKSTVKALAGVDYQRGLAMLKDHVETGSVPSKLEFPGKTPFPGLRYVGMRTKSAIAELGSKMEETFEKLRAWQKDKNVKPAGAPFSIYHRWDLARGRAEYTCGSPLAADASTPDLPGDFITGEIPACDTDLIRHTGPYRHLGNAWAAGRTRARAKVVQHNQEIDPFEVYESDPKDTPENKRVTAVHFPVR